MTSHAPRSKALKPLDILMRDVVTIVVSIADMNKHSHNPAIIVCNLAWLIVGAMDTDGTVGSFTIVVFPLGS